MILRYSCSTRAGRKSTGSTSSTVDCYTTTSVGPRALERRRPRHPHPEASQGRVREVAVARSDKVRNYGKVAPISCRCDNNPNCDLLFGGICIPRLKVVLWLRLVDTEQSLGPRFAGSRHEVLQYEALIDRVRHAKFVGLREDKDART